MKSTCNKKSCQGGRQQNMSHATRVYCGESIPNVHGLSKYDYLLAILMLRNEHFVIFWVTLTRCVTWCVLSRDQVEEPRQKNPWWVGCMQTLALAVVYVCMCVCMYVWLYVWSVSLCASMHTAIQNGQNIGRHDTFPSTEGMITAFVSGYA